MADINLPDFWNRIYQGGRAGWDLDGPTPVFHRLLRSGRFPPGRIVVLGAGRGHDARMFARHGFEVAAADFAEEAVRAMQELADPQAPVEVLQADIFHLPDLLDGTCDYVLEYTCFCAIDPGRRAEYAELAARLLKPGGILIALLFPVSSHQGGPPFAVSPEGFVRLLSERGFTLLDRETPADSVPQRRGAEELLILEFASSG